MTAPVAAVGLDGLVERVSKALDIATKYSGGVHFGETEEGVLAFADLRVLTAAARERDRLAKGLARAADDLRDIGNQSPRPSSSADPEHENYLRRVLISLAQTGNTRARAALHPGDDQ